MPGMRRGRKHRLERRRLRRQFGNLPEESFDYEDFVKREFDADKSPKPRVINWLWWTVAVGLIALFFAGYFFESSK